MALIFKFFLMIVAVLVQFSHVASSRSPKIRSTSDDAELLEKYIVVFKADSNTMRITSHFTKTRGLTKRNGNLVEIQDKYAMGTLNGYAVVANERVIEEIAAADEVDYIEADQWVYISEIVSQASPPWGLGRTSSRTKQPRTYRYDETAGINTWVYILDTGIRGTHSEFGDRATSGPSFIPNESADGHGHGRGPNTAVLSGIQWAINHAASNNRSNCSVMSLSIGGLVSLATNAAVRAAHESGMTVVVAAGNENQSASNVSPASEESAITVGASDEGDARSVWTQTQASNYGPSVNIFAPGTHILSASNIDDTAFSFQSGTSKACPHVAGLAAYLISLEGLKSPKKVGERIFELATRGMLSGLRGSPDRLAFNGVSEEEDRGRLEI